MQKKIHQNIFCQPLLFLPNDSLKFCYRLDIWTKNFKLIYNKFRSQDCVILENPPIFRKFGNIGIMAGPRNVSHITQSQPDSICLPE